MFQVAAEALSIDVRFVAHNKVNECNNNGVLYIDDLGSGTGHGLPIKSRWENCENLFFKTYDPAQFRISKSCISGPFPML